MHEGARPADGPLSDEDRERQQADEDDHRRRVAADIDQLTEIYWDAIGYLGAARLHELRGQGTRPLQAARARYKEVFLRPHDDPGIDAEIQKTLQDWLNEPVPPLEVRPDLILALVLREGFAGRRRGERVSAPEQRNNEMMIRRYIKRYQEIRAEFIAQGKPKAFAAREAAYKAAKAISEVCGLPVAQIIGRRPNRKRRKKLWAHFASGVERRLAVPPPAPPPSVSPPPPQGTFPGTEPITP
jgi:hypothetical protein